MEIQRQSIAPFVVQVLIVIGLVALALGLWRVRDAILLGFAAVVVAVILTAAAAPLARQAPISHRWAVILTLCVFGIVIYLVGSFVGTKITSQFVELVQELPRAFQTLEQRLGVSLPSEADIGQQLSNLMSGSGGSILAGLFGQIASWGWTMVGFVTNLILVVFAGVFLALDPKTYRRGLIMLLSPRFHDRVETTVLQCGEALRYWLVGRALAMVIIGVFAGVGTWLIGLPAPIAIGAFAGLAEFLPIVGPILSAFLALLLALSLGLKSVLWTLLLFVVIQQIESNLLTPTIEGNMVNIPPALLLLSLFAFAILFGLLGVFLATPLTIVALICIKTLYIKGTLGEEVTVLAED